jgi:hypothetical protein
MMKSPVLLLSTLALLSASGCATVQPYERETLARDDMQLERNADASAGAEHAVNYREGSTGAVGARGGGCGCN